MNTASILDVLKEKRTDFDLPEERKNLFRTNSTYISSISYAMALPGVLVKKSQELELNDIDRTWVKLIIKLKEDYKKKIAPFNPIPLNEILTITNQVIKRLEILSIENLYFSISSDESVFFQFAHGFNRYYLELFFDAEEYHPWDFSVEAVLNIYDVNNQAKGYDGSIECVFQYIKQSLPRFHSHITSVANTNSDYEISSSPITQSFL